ncbi:hypothetical protein Esti_001903 [Eimeria stiedai]
MGGVGEERQVELLVEGPSVCWSTNRRAARWFMLTICFDVFWGKQPSALGCRRDQTSGLPLLMRTYSQSVEDTRRGQGALCSATWFAGAGRRLKQRIRTCDSIEPGSWICEYLGERRTLIQILRMQDRQYAYARYVNDNGNKEALNAEFVKIKSQGRVLLRATSDVLEGQEIYAAYGEVFWRNRKCNKLCQMSGLLTRDPKTTGERKRQINCSLFVTITEY